MENSPLRESGITPQLNALDITKKNEDVIKTISNYKFIVNDIVGKFLPKDLSDINYETDFNNIIGGPDRVPTLDEITTKDGYKYYVNKCIHEMIIKRFYKEINELIKEIGIQDIMESYEGLDKTVDIIESSSKPRNLERYFHNTVSGESNSVSRTIIDVDPAVDYTMVYKDMRDAGVFPGEDIRKFPFIPCFDYQKTTTENIDENNTITYCPHVLQNDSGPDNPSSIPSPLTVYDLFEVDFNGVKDDITVQAEIRVDEVYGATNIVSNTYIIEISVTPLGQVKFTKVSSEAHIQFMCRINDKGKMILSIVLYPRLFDIEKKAYFTNLHVKLQPLSENFERFSYIDKHFTSYLFFISWSLNDTGFDGGENLVMFVLTPTKDFKNFVKYEGSFTHPYIPVYLEEFIKRIESGDYYLIGVKDV